MDTVLTANCGLCGHEETIAVDTIALRRFRNGAFVQDAFPYLSEDMRELFFLSGLCPTCWNYLFPEQD